MGLTSREVIVLELEFGFRDGKDRDLPSLDRGFRGVMGGLINGLCLFHYGFID